MCSPFIFSGVPLSVAFALRVGCEARWGRSEDQPSMSGARPGVVPSFEGGPRESRGLRLLPCE